MRFLTVIALVLSLTTALWSSSAYTLDRTRRGPVDLSGLTGALPFICVFPPCPVPNFQLPPIDWAAVQAQIDQWNKEQEQLPG
ncbi:unnamed protein product [Rotaria sp. Silwood1]|nr:unnamed protein product [Rotaria sp. Silwood1]